MAKNFSSYGDLESLFSGINNKKVSKSSTPGLLKNDGSVDTNSYETVTNVSNKNNLKLASSGTTANGEIRFGVDGNGNYGYIKAGADTVTPFKNPTGNKTIPQITQNGTITGIDVADYATASVDVQVPQSSPTLQSKTVSPTTSQQSVTPDSGYDGLSSVTVNAMNLQTKSQTITPQANWSGSTTNATTISPDSGYDGFSSINISTPMIRDNNVLTADAVTTPSTVYNGDTSQSNSAKMLRVHPQKDGMSYTGSYLLVKANSYLGDASAEDVIAGKTFSSANGIQVTGTYSGGATPHTYGVSWSGGTSSSWSRTDEANGVTSPTAYTGSSAYSTVKSFFDSRMPWAGMRQVYVSAVGELIEIPKFWYKWTRSSSTMKLQISDQPQTGFYVSPAHADRGDGVGERDYVYVGRYKCNSLYKSLSGYNPTGATIGSFRTNIHNLDSNAWQVDLAMWWTIRMLYLVEYADWNSQNKIGYGCGNNSSLSDTGLTDTMPYHTGTMGSSRSTYHAGVQYRGIEGLWCNSQEFIDGLYISNNNIYCIKNPANFSSNTGGTYIGTRCTKTGTISAWTNPSSISGFEYALLPSNASGYDYTKYVCDYYGTTDTGKIYMTGGSYIQGTDGGLFALNNAINETYEFLGRLMYLPSSQVKA